MCSEYDLLSEEAEATHTGGHSSSHFGEMKALGCFPEDTVSVNSHKGNKVSRFITLQIPEMEAVGEVTSQQETEQGRSTCFMTYKVVGEEVTNFSKAQL